MSRETFEALLAPNLLCIRMLVRRRIPVSGHAEDVVQAILLRAFAHRGQLRSEAKFGTWLWSIAVNEIRQHFRRGRATLPFAELPYFDAPDGAGSPLSRLEVKETCEWVRSCVAKLPERDRKAIRLRDLEDRSMEDTAVALHSSTPGAKTIHFRARRRLGRILLASGRAHGYIPGRVAAWERLTAG
jgi:RNA polymerase sigma-70 factor (ECF subfamily)